MLGTFLMSAAFFGVYWLYIPGTVQHYYLVVFVCMYTVYIVGIPSLDPVKLGYSTESYSDGMVCGSILGIFILYLCFC